jgi:hypothetical protein
MYRTFTAAALLTFAGLAHADDALDWKLYALSASSPSDALFYLSSDIVRKGDHVQVWVKALSIKRLNAVVPSPELRDPIKRLVAEKYVPPIASIAKTPPEEFPMIIVYEQLADAGVVEPNVKMLIEIDCAQKLYRMLSIVTPTKSGGIVTPWDHVAPESAIATLTELTCKPS